ncbi:MAG: glycosyltransferase [Bacteroidia bacterium]
MDTRPHLLILSYVFPPYPGIGGRRWAKFAKYLSRVGYGVHVVAAQNPFASTSQWQQDIAGLDVTYLPTHFPAVLGEKEAATLAFKLRYKTALLASRMRTRANYYDRAAFWKADMLRAASRLIEQHDIRYVMATGAPFHLLHHALALKHRYPGLKLLCDFRDPWTDGEYLFGMNSLGPARLEAERQMEREVLAQADVVTSVADSIVAQLATKVPGAATRFETLLNGFDPEDFPATTQHTQPDGMVRFVLTGSLYPDIDYIFVPLLDALVRLRSEAPAQYARLAFDFYGQAQRHHQQLVERRDLGEAVRFHGPISLEAVYRVLAASTFTMLFLHEHLAFSRSTKFYEYLAAGRKIVVFSAPGETAAHVEGEGIGYGVAPDEVYTRLLTLIDEADQGRMQPNPAYDIAPYSVPGLTGRLLHLLGLEVPASVAAR